MKDQTINKSKKAVGEDDLLAAILKVKPTADMPKPGAHPPKRKNKKKEKKPTK